MIIFETKRLCARKMTLDDSQFMLGLMTSPHYIKAIGDRGIKSLDDAKQFLTKNYIQSYDQYGYGPYIITLKNTDDIIGCCGLHKRDFLPTPDIGYAISDKHLRMGYTHEAACGVLNYSKEVLKLKKLLAVISPLNLASIQLIEKLNFSFQKEFIWPDGNKPVCIYEKTL